MLQKYLLRLFFLFLLINSKISLATHSSLVFEYEFARCELLKLHVKGNCLTLYALERNSIFYPEISALTRVFRRFYSERPQAYRFINRTDPEHHGLHPDPSESASYHFHICHRDLDYIDKTCFCDTMKRLIDASYLNRKSAFDAMTAFSRSEYLTSKLRIEN